MRTSIIIENKGKNKILCSLSNRSNKNEHQSIYDLVSREFEPHWKKMDEKKKELSIIYLSKFIAKSLDNSDRCLLNYPGDLIKGIIDPVESRKGKQIMYRDIFIS